MADTIALLREACAGNLAANSSLSEDGKTVTLMGTAHDATVPQTLTLSDGKGGTKEVTYTLASIYLQLLHTSVLQYRKACEAAGVEDNVKVLDKGSIIEYFLEPEDDAAAGAAAAPDEGAKEDGDAMDVDDAAEGKKEIQFSQPGSEEKRPRGRDKDRRREKERKDRKKRERSHSKSRKRKESVDEEEEPRKKSKGPMVPITNEQLVANLSTIVDKRDAAAGTPTKEKREGKEDATVPASPGTPMDSRVSTPMATPVPTEDEGLSKEEEELHEKEDRELLMQWLSPAGFQVDSPAVAAAVEADRDAVQKITALEIPVGDSASILRAGAGGEIVEKGGEGAAAGGVKKRDFARVLEIYQEVVAAEEKAKRSSGSSKKRPPPPPPARGGKSPRTGAGTSANAGAVKAIEGNPIIVIPNAMTSAINMINAGFFLGKDAVFVPREQAANMPDAGKRGGTLQITRKLNQRLGGADITYDVIDNPTTRLKRDEWSRVVAVVCQGASWQFKGWKYSDPVELFSRTFGFYVGLEGAKVPSELQGWNVKIGRVSRDRRGLDNVCLASFWNGLEEFMAVHKPGFFQS
ncbi:hypothetical protein ACHAXT_000751 [Thalassiosira profunda]